jgi:hypothetical protein
MTALSDELMDQVESWTHRRFTLKAGTKAWRNGAAVIELSSGKVKPAVSATGLKFLGIFDETIDATSAGPLGSADQPVNVNLIRERWIRWFANDGTIDSADVGSDAYLSDDQTVSLNSTNQCLVGVILEVDTTKGVAVEIGQVEQ